jgi:L-2-hydroxyglutarate oxidase
VVIGAGIIGLATARALRATGHEVVVLDKEAVVGRHQSGHNSGVVHSGLYYRPGSLKARLCAEGRSELETFCEARAIPLDRCGKVVVATRIDQLGGLAELQDRGRRNGLDVRWLDRRGIADHEPHVDGVAGLFVRATGVVSYEQVCVALRDELVAAGCELRLHHAVRSIDEHEHGVRVRAGGGELAADLVVNCAGLHADRVARSAGIEPTTSIVPFRGEYLELAPRAAGFVRHLIYPVPDPRFPFLGVHLSRGVDDHVHAGPNAVLALAREGYRWVDVDSGDLAAMARDPGVRRLATRYWRTGVGELARSLSRRLMVREIQRLVPDVRAEDLRPAGSGVRAQAVATDGSLVDDFSLAQTARTLHVLNAPSPGATASLALGRWIATRLTATAPWGGTQPGPSSHPRDGARRATLER